MSRERILVVDDEPEIRRLVQEILADEGYDVTAAENAQAARDAYTGGHQDLVLLDIWMPDTDGITLLKEWLAADGRVPVVMMSGHGTVETAVEAIRLGAYDFIEKPLSTAKLLLTVEHALQADRLRRENQQLRAHIAPPPVLVGRSRPMQQLREDIKRIAAHDSWVLIRGEAGSGKKVAARALHAASPRRERPFVEISLAAVAAPNLAVQLYGSERDGEVSPGSIEQAGGGTLFLDEIADLDATAQAHLLNTLEERRFLRVGGRDPVDMDVRVIAATHQDLKRAVADGRFREDLYYRINVLPLHVPSLREHREDVPELVGHLVTEMIEQEHLPYRRFSTAALNLLRNYTWPGNIRELKNVVQRLLILSQGEEIGDAEVTQALGATQPVGPEVYPAPLLDLPLRAARDRFEKAYLEHHLREVGGNVAELARIVEMERTHLYRKLKALGIDPRQTKDE